MSFNPRQKRDRDGKFAGGGYVGRHHVKPTVTHRSGSFSRPTPKSRPDVVRQASGKKIVANTASILPVRGIKSVDETKAKAQRYRQQVLSGEIVKYAAAPKSMAKYGRGPLAPEVALQLYGNPFELGLSQKFRDQRQRRSSNPQLARRQKLGRQEHAVSQYGEGRDPDKLYGRKPAFPNQARARKARLPKPPPRETIAQWSARNKAARK